MNLYSDTRTNFVTLMMKNCPNQKNRLIELFESLSEKCLDESIKISFQEIANEIKNNDNKHSDLTKYLKALNVIHLNFNFSQNNSFSLYSMPKFLAFCDTSNNIICKYSLQTTSLTLIDTISKNLHLVNSIIISYSNGKAFIQQRPLGPTTLHIACLVTNPQIINGSIYLIGNSVFHFKIDKGKLTTKLKKQDLKPKGPYNYSIKSCENSPGSFSINRVSYSNKNLKQATKWVINYDNKEQVGRALHNKKSLKNNQNSYPLSLYEGMEFLMGQEKYIVNFLEE